MLSKQNRLDRFISSTVPHVNKKDVRVLLARGEITVDGMVATNINQVINEFSIITLNGEVLQNNTPLYVMLNKPKCVVSATKDEKNRTVIDCLEMPNKEALHIVGRLDLNTTGLLLLSNNGRWSRQLMSPENKITKVYKVTLEKYIDPKLIEHFAQGLYFPYENITTKPATLKILSDKSAELGLVEGRYHQVKRMFGHFDNKVLELHRQSIGHINLDSELGLGESRMLIKSEIECL